MKIKKNQCNLLTVFPHPEKVKIFFINLGNTLRISIRDEYMQGYFEIMQEEESLTDISIQCSLKDFLQILAKTHGTQDRILIQGNTIQVIHNKSKEIKQSLSFPAIQETISWNDNFSEDCKIIMKDISLLKKHTMALKDWLIDDFIKVFCKKNELMFLGFDGIISLYGHLPIIKKNTIKEIQGHFPKEYIELFSLLQGEYWYTHTNQDILFKNEHEYWKILLTDIKNIPLHLPQHDNSDYVTISVEKYQEVYSKLNKNLPAIKDNKQYSIALSRHIAGYIYYGDFYLRVLKKDKEPINICLIKNITEASVCSLAMPGKDWKEILQMLCKNQWILKVKKNNLYIFDENDLIFTISE